MIAALILAIGSANFVQAQNNRGGNPPPRSSGPSQAEREAQSRRDREANLRREGIDPNSRRGREYSNGNISLGQAKEREAQSRRDQGRSEGGGGYNNGGNRNQGGGYGNNGGITQEELNRRRAQSERDRERNSRNAGLDEKRRGAYERGDITLEEARRRQAQSDAAKAKNDAERNSQRARFDNIRRQQSEVDSALHHARQSGNQAEIARLEQRKREVSSAQSEYARRYGQQTSLGDNRGSYRYNAGPGSYYRYRPQGNGNVTTINKYVVIDNSIHYNRDYNLYVPDRGFGYCVGVCLGDYSNWVGYRPFWGVRGYGYYDYLGTWIALQILEDAAIIAEMNSRAYYARQGVPLGGSVNVTVTTENGGYAHVEVDQLDEWGNPIVTTVTQNPDGSTTTTRTTTKRGGWTSGDETKTTTTTTPPRQ